jgi:hypothetical protein
MIFISTTAKIKNGGKDTYKLLAEVPAGLEKYSFVLSVKSTVYKIVLEGKHNSANCQVHIGEATVL